MVTQAVIPRFHWLVYGSPGSNVSCRVSISVVGKTALNALKLSLTTTIGFVNTSALLASARRVAWVNRYDWHAFAFGLVFDLQAKIAKSPVRESCALPASDGCPTFTDAAEFLDGNAAVAVLRLSHDGFTDDMVGVFLKASLSASQLAQLAFRDRKSVV